jgi:hypothetical protein
MIFFVHLKSVTPQAKAGASEGYHRSVGTITSSAALCFVCPRMRKPANAHPYLIMAGQTGTGILRMKIDAGRRMLKRIEKRRVS